MVTTRESEREGNEQKRESERERVSRSEREERAGRERQSDVCVRYKTVEKKDNMIVRRGKKKDGRLCV